MMQLEAHPSTSVKALRVHMQSGCNYYNFYQNLQNVRSDIAHFQVDSSTPKTTQASAIVPETML